MSVRKSEAQRQLEGSHPSYNRNEPKPVGNKPSKPRGLQLGKDAARLWDKLVPQLETLGLVTAIDETSIICLCQWWQVYCDASKQLAVMEDLSSIEGARALNAASKSFDNFRRLSQQFGLSPQARTGISIDIPQVNELGDTFFN